MLARSAPSNTSGNRVTTLILSIVAIHRHRPVPPASHRRPAGDAFEAEQPFPVIRPAPRQNQGSRQHPPLIVHDVEPGLGREDRSRILDQREHGDFPLLAVRLPQPPDYAGREPNTPAFLRRERTVSVGVAPLAIHARADSLFT